MKTKDQLCVEAHAYVIEACQLGDEAISIAFKAAKLALDDPKRWSLSRRMLEINHRLKEITEEISREDRTVQEHPV
jgi:hypothetical protein